MKRILIGCLVALSCTLAAPAQTQQEMNQQAAADFAAADRELNAAYKQLMGKLDKASREKLIDAQLIWIKLRDADGAARAAGNEGGSIYPLIYDGSRAASTRDRTRWLREWYDEVKGL